MGHRLVDNRHARCACAHLGGEVASAHESNAERLKKVKTDGVITDDRRIFAGPRFVTLDDGRRSQRRRVEIAEWSRLCDARCLYAWQRLYAPDQLLIKQSAFVFVITLRAGRE